MKKIICTVCMVIFILSSVSTCFADIEDNDIQQIEPRFVGTFLHMERLSISSSGYATTTARLEPKSEDSIDEVKVTMTLKKIDGTLIRKKTYDAVWSQTYFEFQAADHKQLTDKGAYYLDVTYKCYKDGKLLETLTGSAADTY